MSTFHDVGALADFPTGKAHRVIVDDVEVALVVVGEEVFAVHDECSHAGVALTDGDVYNCTIECPLHGAGFDLRTGAALTPPATAPIPTYQVKIDASNVEPRVLVSIATNQGDQ
jgi:3-phenylpropionate/trans-cinnamate dioxygenase ferredoxin subunit